MGTFRGGERGGDSPGPALNPKRRGPFWTDFFCSLPSLKPHGLGFSFFSEFVHFMAPFFYLYLWARIVSVRRPLFLGSYIWGRGIGFMTNVCPLFTRPFLALGLWYLGLYLSCIQSLFSKGMNSLFALPLFDLPSLKPQGLGSSF